MIYEYLKEEELSEDEINNLARQGWRLIHAFQSALFGVSDNGDQAPREYTVFFIFERELKQ